MEDNNIDFWDELSKERQKNIDQALKEVQEGKTIPHAVVRKEILKSIRKAERDIKEGKLYSLEESREMLQKKRRK